MCEEKSDYVGTESKIKLVGTFDCHVEYTSKKIQAEQGIIDKDIVKLYCPMKHGLKTGDMVALTGHVPTHKIMKISEYTNHVVCEVETWT